MWWAIRIVNRSCDFHGLAIKVTYFRSCVSMKNKIAFSLQNNVLAQTQHQTSYIHIFLYQWVKKGTMRCHIFFQSYVWFISGPEDRFSLQIIAGRGHIWVFGLSPEPIWASTRADFGWKSTTGSTNTYQTWPNFFITTHSTLYQS